MTRIRRSRLLIVALVALGLIGITLYHLHLRAERTALQNAIASYLASPGFSNEDMANQLFGINARLSLYDVGERKLYFTLPSSESIELALPRLSLRPTMVEVAEKSEDGQKLDGFTLYRTDRHFLRFPLTDLRVDPEARVQIQYPSARFEITAAELAADISNATIYCGKAWIENGQKRWFNFGAYVAKPGIRPLTKLAEQLTDDDQAPLTSIQVLLDFVSQEIEYDEEEVRQPNRIQVARRSTETLLTGKATCGSKAVLYASLLEQRGIEYFLAFYQNHLAVFVRADELQSANGYILREGAALYHLAETTAPGFKIGLSQMEKDPTQGLNYLYSPGRDRLINMAVGTESKLRK